MKKRKPKLKKLRKVNKQQLSLWFYINAYCVYQTKLWVKSWKYMFCLKTIRQGLFKILSGLKLLETRQIAFFAGVSKISWNVCRSFLEWVSRGLRLCHFYFRQVQIMWNTFSFKIVSNYSSRAAQELSCDRKHLEQQAWMSRSKTAGPVLISSVYSSRFN